jgi:hypothetical protein
MNETSTPHLRDVASVGTRVSWGAVFAGAILALAIGLLCGTLGAAVGISVHDRTSVDKLMTGSMAWAYITTFIALFVGGLVTTLLTVGEDKTEAVLHGVLMWALLIGILLSLAGMGIRVGVNMVGLAYDQNDVRRTIDQAAAPENRPVVNEEAAKRYAWYTFAGTWLSMLAAAGGAFAGAGPTFRVVTRPRAAVV